MKKHPAKVVPALACLLSCSLFAAPAQAQEASLPQAVQQVVKKNPEVVARWHAFRAATEEIDAASGGYRPRVDLSGDLSRDRLKSLATGNVTTDYTQRDLSLSLEQMLFDGGRTSNQVGKFNHMQRLRYAELLETSENQALETMRTYVDVLRYRTLHHLAAENYTHHRAVFEQIQQRTQSGVGRKVDQQQAQGRLALAESNLLTEASNLHDVNARYQRIVGTLPPAQMADVPELNNGIPESSNEALRKSYAQNPALIAAQENIMASQLDAKTHDSRFMPRLSLLAQQDVGKNLGGPTGRRDATSIGLRLNYNLYNGGTDQAAQRQAIEQSYAAKETRDKVCRDVRQTLYISYNDVQRLKQQLNYLEQHMRSQEKALEAYYSQFDIGQRTLLDLLDAENEVFQAKRAFQNARFDYLLAMGRTHAAMGNLVKSLDANHLDSGELAQTEESAEFDPNTVCPADAPEMLLDDKEALYAAYMPVIKDSDGDGIPDDRDACPDTPPGTRVDVRGCPLKEVTALQGVTFEYYSAKLRPESRPVLDDVAATLQKNADLKVEIAGHTDNQNRSKNPQLNVDLSQQRATAVMEYLISRGIAADRLTAKGYGETQPVADNATAEGQAKNRRVELRIQH
ncbi:MAG: TolC family outer membrane protein [Sterolibacterium sp.]|nr:TolC family outer membrane protein [Sterolibacterium sp.]